MGDTANPGTIDDGSVIDAEEAQRPRGIVVVSSPDERCQGRVVAIDESLSIGRTGGDLVIDDEKMSRLHASIRRLPGGRQLEIRDHGSRNGTRVGGEPIEGAVVADEAIVRLGQTILALGPLPAPAIITAGPLVGWSTGFQQLVAHAERVAGTGLPVLLLGETGTGKELVARHIHRLSGRPGPFVPINCAAIPGDLVEATLFGHKKGAFTGALGDSSGYFRDADGGTLFLDEIGALGAAAQPKLLRVLESGDFSAVGSTTIERADIRVVSASNADLENDASGMFRRDLFARLAAVVIHLPPLRARRVDILLLLRHLWAHLAPGRKLRVSASFVENLLLHPWPLNVRELRIVAQRLSLLDVGEDIFSSAHLREVLLSVAGDPPRAEARDAAPRPSAAQLKEELTHAHGNVSKVAQRYGKDPRQIRRWLQQYGLSADDFRRS